MILHPQFKTVSISQKKDINQLLETVIQSEHNLLKKREKGVISIQRVNMHAVSARFTLWIKTAIEMIAMHGNIAMHGTRWWINKQTYLSLNEVADTLI